jgi:hypothetical protein
MIDIVDRLEFDSVRCEAQFSKGVAGNITEAAAEITRLREALEVFADPSSWRLNGMCDPNSSNFRGQQIAVSALSREEREPRTAAGSLD